MAARITAKSENKGGPSQINPNAMGKDTAALMILRTICRLMVSGIGNCWIEGLGGIFCLEIMLAEF